MADLRDIVSSAVNTAALATPSVAPIAVPVTVTVEKMVESVNGVSWWVVLRRGKHRQDDGKYGAEFKNRAEWHAAGLRWILGQGDKPNIRDFMDDTSSTASTSAGLSPAEVEKGQRAEKFSIENVVGMLADRINQPHYVKWCLERLLATSSAIPVAPAETGGEL